MNQRTLNFLNSCAAAPAGNFGNVGRLDDACLIARGCAGVGRRATGGGGVGRGLSTFKLYFDI